MVAEIYPPIAQFLSSVPDTLAVAAAPPPASANLPAVSPAPRGEETIGPWTWR
jgi:hypothetical protein